MIPVRVLLRLAVKELRALFPPWAACVVVFGCLIAARSGTAASPGGVHALGMLTYGAAAVALGALSIGHEYSHGTLALMLSQPVGRIRLYVTKACTLALMLVALAVIAWGTVLSEQPFTVDRDGKAALALATLGGLCIAPWLTMLTRNPLAGTVLTITLPGWVWIFINVSMERAAKPVTFWWIMVGLAATAAVLGWRTFMRLEAIDGRDSDLRLPYTRRTATPVPRDRHAVWVLLKKELGLQQLSLAVAGFYSAAWLALAITRQIASADTGSAAEDLTVALTILYSGMLALLIGALASAEERQLGTLDWQMLLPMAAWKQWALKVGMTVGLSMLLGVGLPALLVSMSGDAVKIPSEYPLGTLLLTVGSLYVSSLSSNGLRAFVVSLPVTVIVWLLIAWFTTPQWLAHPLAWLTLALFLMLVLQFALVNHRSAERGSWRVFQQVFILCGCFAFAAAVVAVVVQ